MKNSKTGTNQNDEFWIAQKERLQKKNPEELRKHTKHARHVKESTIIKDNMMHPV